MKNLYDLYIVDTDGSNVHQLTHDVGYNYATSWSPDGQNIIFASNRDGQYGVFTMKVDGSAVKRLTIDKSKSSDDPMLSPDGKAIAFVITRDNNIREIYTMNTNGNNQRRLTMGGNANHATWSPDGKSIIFSLKPDGAQKNQLYIMRADGSKRQLMATDSSLDIYSPSWSPDGKSIAYGAQDNTGNGIYLMDGDGSNVQRLTNQKDVFRTWSPDGKQITFLSSRDSSIGRFWVMNTDGTSQHPLDNAKNPDDDNLSWSADGNQIVYQSRRSGNLNIYLADATGLNERQLTFLKEPYFAGLPLWLDKQTILFFSKQSSQKGDLVSIFTMNVDGSNQ